MVQGARGFLLYDYLKEYDTCTVPIRYLYSTNTILVQYQYDTCTVPVPYLYSTNTILVQYQYDTCTVPVRYLYSTSTILVQYQYDTCTVPIRYLYSTNADASNKNSCSSPAIGYLLQLYEFNVISLDKK